MNCNAPQWSANLPVVRKTFPTFPQCTAMVCNDLQPSSSSPSPSLSPSLFLHGLAVSRLADSRTRRILARVAAMSCATVPSHSRGPVSQSSESVRVRSHGARRSLFFDSVFSTFALGRVAKRMVKFVADKLPSGPASGAKLSYMIGLNTAIVRLGTCSGFHLQTLTCDSRPRDFQLADS